MNLAAIKVVMVVLVIRTRAMLLWINLCGNVILLMLVVPSLFFSIRSKILINNNFNLILFP